MATRMPALYVTGEESQQQVAMRARRLGLPQDQLKVMTETCIESIIATAKLEKPKVMVIDSIQTIFTEQLQSAPAAFRKCVKVRHCWCVMPSPAAPRSSSSAT